MRPSPASCSESSSAPTPRSTSTTAGPSPRYTAARRAERCSFESISLCVVLRCQAQAVAHHPRRERRRLASASPASCPGAGSVDVTGGTSRHLSTPKRLARVARLLPRPSRRSWRPDPAATHVSAFSEVMEPLPVHASVDSPKPRRQAALRPFSEVRRREPAVVCQQPPVVGSTQLGGHRQSRPRSRRDYRNRGVAIARTERAREQEQSRRAPAAHDWIWAEAVAAHRRLGAELCAPAPRCYLCSHDLRQRRADRCSSEPHGA